MNDIDYTSGPGGYSLRTQAPGASAVQMPGVPQTPGVQAGTAPDFNFFAQLAQRRMADERRLREAEEARRQEAHDMQLQSAAAANRQRGQMGDMQRDAMREGMRRENYQDQIKRNGPPLRMISGPGIVSGYGQDVNAMNAYQRDAYLPEKSEFESGGMSASELFKLKNGEEKWDPLAHGRSRLG